jgi:hypothetical protein
MLQANLETVYGDVDAVDLFIGGLAEKHARAAQVGPTFQAIIARQFEALGSGDRFYRQNQPFDRTTAYMIGNTTLAAIIPRDTDTTTLQANVFLASQPDTTKTRCRQAMWTRTAEIAFLSRCAKRFWLTVLQQCASKHQQADAEIDHQAGHVHQCRHEWR